MEYDEIAAKTLKKRKNSFVYVPFALFLRLFPLPGVSARLGRPAVFRRFFFDRDDVQTGNCDAAIVIKPNDNAASVRVNTSVISAGNAVTIAAAGDDREGLKRPSLQKMTHICDRLFLRIPRSRETGNSIKAA